MSQSKRPGTKGVAYALRLQRRSATWWKRALGVQAPYRWNIRRLVSGYVLDVGCGIGRNLAHLDGNGVGVDHNSHAVTLARSIGLQAFTTGEFDNSEYNQAGRFDSMLLAHVVEHMTPDEAAGLMERYLPLVRKSGRVILICPQEAGYRSDPTHVTFMGFDELRALVSRTGLSFEAAHSFPFPRFVGKFFRHNEFVVVASNNRS